MFKLGVNIDHVATLRQARGGVHPRPLDAAKVCKKAGADSIVMHLREDRRHVQDRDVFEVRRHVAIRLNLEMSLAPGIVSVARKVKPDQVTLVPEKRQEKTTEGGLDVKGNRRELERLVLDFRRRGIVTSLFVDPDDEAVRLSRAVGADSIELHTGDYANMTTSHARKRELRRLKAAAVLGRSLGLDVHAGHGLDYENVAALKAIPELCELNIGYSIVTRALWSGLDAAVREMRRLIR